MIYRVTKNWENKDIFQIVLFDENDNQHDFDLEREHAIELLDKLAKFIVDTKEVNE